MLWTDFMKQIRIVLAGLLALTFVTLGVLLLGRFVCSSILRKPRTNGTRAAGANAAEIVAADGAILKAWWFPQGAESKGCVIILHGLGESRSSSSGFVTMFQKHGYAVLTPDNRGHGDSGGEFVTHGLLEKYDVKQWAEWVRGKGCKRVYGLGESLGAVILIQAVAITPGFHAIVAESPFADFRKSRADHICKRAYVPRFVADGMVEVGVLYARLFYHYDLDEISPLKSIAATSTPILLIHGLADTRTSPEDSRRLNKAARGPHELWLVPNAKHVEASSAAPEEFERRVMDWFSAHREPAAGIG